MLTNSCVESAKGCMWSLFRFRDMGATREQLLNLWIQKGRSELEFASPVFFSRLTEDQNKQIEKIQRMALAIILQNDYKSYSSALNILSQKTLADRRQEAAIRFGEKCLVNPRHADMFIRNDAVQEDVSRRNRKPLKEYFCRTERFFKSSIPTITRLLNEKYLKEN